MSCKLGITSMSLGWARAGHKLEDKLRTAHASGYQGVELFHGDLDDLAARRFEPTSPPAEPADETCASSHAAQLAAARHVRQLCAALGLTIICLQPFNGYEGLLDRAAQAAKMARLERWIQLAHALGTDMIQIPSSLAPAAETTGDLDVLARDLQRVADVGAAARPPLRFVYEALCFGTRVDLWEDSWAVVQRVNRPNFGLCLDSFNIAGRIYADPAAPSGTTPDADAAVEASMKRLAAEVDVSKVFYVQIVDAERLASPLVEGHAYYNAEQPARMSWSRNCRLFYGEHDRGAYLPIRRIAQAFFQELNFRGWVSLELFNRRMGDEGDDVTTELAQRGAESWDRLARDFNLTKEEPAALLAEQPAQVVSYVGQKETEAPPRTPVMQQMMIPAV